MRDGAAGWAWPKSEPASFNELADAVARAVRFAYTLRRKNRDADIPWTGPPIGEKEAVRDLSFDERLSAEYLRSAEEEQGRDPLRTIIAIAIQLGMEQERRCSKKDNSQSSELRKLQRKLRGIKRAEAQRHQGEQP